MWIRAGHARYLIGQHKGLLQEDNISNQHTTLQIGQERQGKAGLVWQPTWAHLKQLHATVKQSARPLLYGTYSNLSLGNLTEAHVFQTGSNCVAFLVNANLHGKVDIQFRNNKFELLARSVIILSQCNKIIFNTAEVTAQSYTRSSKVLQFLNDASKWSWTSERIPDLKGAKFANKLLDQLSTTKDATDYLWYITRYNSTSAGGNQVLRVESDAHVIHAFVNNMLVGNAHGNDQDPSATLDAKFVPNKGENTISLLSVMVGSPVKEPIQQLAKRIKAEVQ
ncbi:Beta-galactosidase 6 [Carex littledalei]|uniref:Beta-galactosidase 6 n=1 Tax=Carex littledalei TaxID=544730 RepID=A0A833VW78_9POAL|nr:Beta-galactosidase 6 [Carex littledalei]